MESRPPSAPPLAFEDGALDFLSHLLWSASREPGQGRDPMSRLFLFVASPGGGFLYDPRAHALRLRRDGALAERVDAWLEEDAARPEDVPDDSAWLRWEQEKHQRLLEELRDAG